MAEGGVFEANVPLVVIVFHFVALVLDADFLVFAVCASEPSSHDPGDTYCYRTIADNQPISNLGELLFGV